MQKIVLAAAFVVALPAFAQLSAPANGPQLVASHRGASAYAPEHTLFAYDLAIEQDTDLLECDVILTKDEVPVCIHDETIDRTVADGKTGRVDSYTLAELREFDFGSWFNTANPTLAKSEYVGAKIVPFEEELDCYLRHNPKLRFYPETKDSAGGRAEQILQEMLTRKGLIDTGDPMNRVQTATIVLQSFDPGSLQRMRSLNSTIPTGFLYTAPTSIDILQYQLTGDGPDYIDFFIPNSAAILIDPTLVQRYHAAGHDVHTWTVNDANQMDLLLSLGVDALFTNNSDVLRARIDAKGSGTTPEQRNNPKNFAHGCVGIAGRVTSKDGPGDVWEPTGLRGVQLKSASAGSVTPVPAVPVAAPDTASGRFGGGSLGSVMLGLFGFAALRRKLSR
ncbi:MAG: glycerophosphodiester phosphodiesterase family protein [Stagnimonas sp.]|nr:glycerophosphodiester phosphodiesterase family protein [Stagnimonas sp.]